VCRLPPPATPFSASPLEKIDARNLFFRGGKVSDIDTHARLHAFVMQIAHIPDQSKLLPYFTCNTLKISTQDSDHVLFWILMG
jgi:hypothetical protein